MNEAMISITEHDRIVNDVTKLLAEQYDQKISQLKEQLRYLTHARYGKKSETISDKQLGLFDELDLKDMQPEPTSEEPQKDILVPEHKRKKRGKRSELDPSLPRTQTFVDITEEEKQCDCGSCKVRIGEVISEQLEITPAQFNVNQIIRYKYACNACKNSESMVTAPLLPSIIPKSNASPSLLAHMVTSKFVDYLPLHRQMMQFKRYGLILNTTTMSRWMVKLSTALIPLYNAIYDAIFDSNYVQCDETPIQVLKEPNRPASSKSQMWVMRTDNVVYYRYSESRASRVVVDLLGHFEGYVQCDGLASYNILENPIKTTVDGKEHSVPSVISLVGCMAHVRRKFVDAMNSAGKAEYAVKTKASEAVKLIARLYEVENKAARHGLSHDEIKTLRAYEAIPILDEFKEWLNNTYFLPKFKLGKAITYALNQWDKIIRYCEDGQLLIDNNRDERAVRPVAMGRKNWLFSKSVDGSDANARIMTLIRTSMLNGHEPFAYFSYVLEVLPTLPVDQHDTLLPWVLKPEDYKDNK